MKLEELIEQLEDPSMAHGAEVWVSIGNGSHFLLKSVTIDGEGDIILTTSSTPY